MKNWMPIAFCGLVVVASIAVQVGGSPLVDSVRDLVFDEYQRLGPRAPARGATAVAVVDIDDESLRRLGQWPWPRTILADLVERVRADGAAAIAFDMVFAEPDRSSPEQLLALLPDHPRLDALLAKLPSHDSRFADAISGGRVVTGFALKASGGAPDRQPLLKSPFVFRGEIPYSYVRRYPSATANLAPLERAAAGNGSLNSAIELDKVIRDVPLLVALGDTFYPSLAVEALRVAGGGALAVRTDSSAGVSAGVEAVGVGSRVIETDSAGRMRLHWSRYDPARYVPAWEILDGRAPRTRLAGRIVLVGTSAAGLKDIFYSARGLLVPGVEGHAQAIENLLTGEYLKRPHWTRMAEAALTLSLAAIIWAAVVRLRPAWAAVTSGAVLAAGGALSWWAFRAHHLLLDATVPGATALAVYLAVSVHRHIATEGERRFIRQAFQSYVSPNLVRHLLRNPRGLGIGGERRECSFVMTDLTDFTSLIEKAEPGHVVGWLNEYIDGMTRVAFAHEGTLDRIVGDAVAVMFSAPVTQADHRQRALACALAMDAFASEFQTARRAEGIPWGTTRVGAHAGPVMVGNFGGKAIHDYRALGDAINTAARLEAANKQLGTRVCLSEAIVAACPEFVGRPVGALVLKGKSEPVAAWEPLTSARAASAAAVAYREAYALLEKEDPGAPAAFERVLSLDPTDALAHFHRERLGRGETGATVVLSAK